MGRHWGTPWDRGCVLTPHSFLSAPWGWRSCTGCRAGLLPGLESPPPHDPVLRVQEGSELSSGPQGGVPQPLLASRGGTLPSWEGVGQDWVWGERAPPAMRPRWSTALGTGVVSGPGPLEIAPVPLRTPVFVCDLDPQRARKVGVLSSPAGPPVRAGGAGFVLEAAPLAKPRCMPRKCFREHRHPTVLCPHTFSPLKKGARGARSQLHALRPTGSGRVETGLSASARRTLGCRSPLCPERGAVSAGAALQTLPTQLSQALFPSFGGGVSRASLGSQLTPTQQPVLRAGVPLTVL